MNWINRTLFLLLALTWSLNGSAAEKAASNGLQAGFAQIDITPPIGAIITGPAGPKSTGTDDPAAGQGHGGAERGSETGYMVGVDLVKIRHDLADQIIALVMQQTNITRDAVLVCPSHNHSGPLIPETAQSLANKTYIDTLPKLIADSIVQADKALTPARMSIGRSLVYEGHVNRRLIAKTDGLVLNTWLKKLDDLKEVPQVLGSEGVIDPELWVVRFDALDGKMLGTLVNFTCHPCLHDRIKIHTWSADFPGVIAEHMAQAYGKQAVSVFTQGCSGNIQPPVPWAPDWKERSAVFAKAAVEAALKMPSRSKVPLPWTICGETWMCRAAMPRRSAQKPSHGWAGGRRPSKVPGARPQPCRPC